MPSRMLEHPAMRPKAPLTDGQRAYEARRAAKAGVSLEKWLATKDRQAAEAARAETKAAGQARKAAKKPSIFSRLIDRAHKPL
jgi:hypothetical protein